MLLDRGLQKFEKGQHYETIKLLGRAQSKLIKHECQEDLIFCLIVCAKAYEGVGLLWAAHANLLSAASIGLSKFGDDGIASNQAHYCIIRLIWTELQLGRIPQILTYMQFATMLAQHLKLSEEILKNYSEQLKNQDGILGMLMLRASIAQLQVLNKLPKTLDAMGLYMACMSLLYALGDEEALIAEGLIPEGTPSEEIHKTFEMLSKQPAKDDIAERIEIFNTPTINMTSAALGCQWNVTTDNDQISIRTSEAFLGFIESFFATSLETDAIPHRQEINICVRRASQQNETDTGNDLRIIVDDPNYILIIEHSPSYDPTMQPMDGTFQNFLRDTLAMLIPRILHVPNLELYFDRIAKDEGGFDRSLTFSDVFSSASNVVGSTPIFTIYEWLNNEHTYALQRTEQITFANPAPTKKQDKPSYGSGEPPPELHKTDNLKHSQRRVLSFIDVNLWDTAKWRGAAVAIYEKHPPILALMFENEKAARAIFSGWKQKLGSRDENDQLRISIVTGVDKKYPSSYKVLVTANLDNAFLQITPLDQVIMTSRCQLMPNPNPRNLQMLKEAYDAIGYFMLAPIIIDPTGGEPNVLTDVGIYKRPLNIRPAWEIGEHDPDLMAITLEDDPIIPDGITDPPVSRLLERKKKMKG
jgi:hypothetical protein